MQLEDLDALFCALAGAGDPDPEQERAHRQSFDGWVASRYAGYEQGRDAGWVEFLGDGIVLTKTFALGKGTFYSLDPGLSENGRIEVRMRIRFAYADIDVSELPPGTVFYVAGAPPGRIHPVRIPYGPARISEEVLETLAVRWTLARTPATPTCPEGWDVVSVEPLTETASTASLTWEF